MVDSHAQVFIGLVQNLQPMFSSLDVQLESKEPIASLRVEAPKQRGLASSLLAVSTAASWDQICSHKGNKGVVSAARIPFMFKQVQGASCYHAPHHARHCE
jgi:hypothetical protein